MNIYILYHECFIVLPFFSKTTYRKLQNYLVDEFILQY